jgi:hypothetical protein
MTVFTFLAKFPLSYFERSGVANVRTDRSEHRGPTTTIGR